VSLEQVFEAYEVLAELMGMAAALAAQRMTLASKAQLQAVHGDMATYVGTDRRDAYVVLDAKFHQLILAGCANRVLLRQIADCKKTIAVVRHASINSHASLEMMYAEHESIVKAVVGGAAEDARRAMWLHVHLRADRAGELVEVWRKQPRATSTQSYS
jgi:DNA-binding GntR family transcriptional regulator